MKKIISLIISCFCCCFISSAQLSFALIHEQIDSTQYSLKAGYVFTAYNNIGDTTYYTVTHLEDLLNQNSIIDTVYIVRNNNRYYVESKHHLFDASINISNQTLKNSNESLPSFEIFKNAYDPVYLSDSVEPSKGIYFDHLNSKWYGWKNLNNRYVILHHLPIDKIQLAHANQWTKKAFLASEMTKTFQIAIFNHDNFIDYNNCITFDAVGKLSGRIKNSRYEFSIFRSKMPYDKNFALTNKYNIDISQNSYPLQTEISVQNKLTDSIKYVLQWIEPLYVDYNSDTFFIAKQWKNTTIKSSVSTTENNHNRLYNTKMVSWSNSIAFGPLNTFIEGNMNEEQTIWEVKDVNGKVLNLLTNKLVDGKICNDLIRILRKDKKLFAEIIVNAPSEISILWKPKKDANSNEKKWQIESPGIHLLELGKDLHTVETLNVEIIFSTNKDNQSITISKGYDNIAILK